MNDVMSYLPTLLRGLGMSFLLLLALVAIGTPLAFLLAVAQRSRFSGIRWIAIAFIEIARGIPSLILLYLVYFGLPSVNLSLSSFTAAAIGLGINYAGYVSETVKSGLDAVPRGQTEAAAALGLGRGNVTRFVTIPQSVRIITPPFLSWIIVYFQTTSIAFAIAVPELMSAAYSVANANFQYLTLFIIAGLLYAIISIPGSQLTSVLERKRSR
ncbi:amino acid ABC transporter permease [Rothia sp. AR01]|uniref:Amino acid ABC transporter permease n=1 Tax=Rothia santali TaxID=2949643 RepID=A0A9X2HJN6_9MICC|nr:amino acid ABC transporter permease [Rothia santali]MCP3426946.1 amino acid ABC transporter permease [Rothia santali]